jgi:hypothetical protein
MDLRSHLLEGQAIPAQPLALDAVRKFSERHQRAITRYYLDAGVGGLAVGVHSTQFEIRELQHGLFKPVLELAAAEIDASLKRRPRPFARIAGLCGKTDQALREAELALSFGYDAGLLSLAAWKGEKDEAILAHCATIAETIPVIGFYLQPSVGGRIFSYSFWRRFAEIPHLVAIKIAPFNRYQTLDVVRAVIEAGRDDVALYTGNDDNIVVDLLTPFAFGEKNRRIAGGLLGHWGVWTRSAVELLEEIKRDRENPQLPASWLTRAIAVTDMNAAVFDPAHGFAGCIPGILEVLRRQGLTPTCQCLNPDEVLSPGQADELTRVARAYPELTDDAFIAENLDRWLS